MKGVTRFIFSRNSAPRRVTDEQETKAAAVTGIQLSDPSGPPSVRADKPFFFLIRDNRTGSVLFLGRVVDPRGT